MKKVKDTLDFIIYNDFGVKWEFFIDASNKYYKQKIMELYPEFYEEMVGFAEGCSAGGTKMTVDEVVAWNIYFTLTESWWSNMPEEDTIALKGSVKSNVSSKREAGLRIAAVHLLPLETGRRMVK